MLSYPGDRSLMAERLAKEYFLTALEDPELDLRDREKEPQSLDAALKSAQCLEVFRNAVRQRRQRMNRQITESPAFEYDSLCEWEAKIEHNSDTSFQHVENCTDSKQHLFKDQHPRKDRKKERKDKKTKESHVCYEGQRYTEGRVVVTRQINAMRRQRTWIQVILSWLLVKRMQINGLLSSSHGMVGVLRNRPILISVILQLMNQSSEKPAWKVVTMHSHNVKVLWGIWDRLWVCDGTLQRKFESLDGLSTHWQVNLPKSLRKEFLSVIHGGMTGGHLARKCTAAAIQLRAYWPTWSSDLDLFLNISLSCNRTCHKHTV